MSVAPDNSPRAQSDFGSSIRLGQILTVNAGGFSVRCVVVQASNGSALLVPLQPTPGFQMALDPPPTDINVAADNGMEVSVTADSLIPVQALSISLPATHANVDNRQSFRIKLDYDVEVSSDGIDWQKAHGENLSEGGLRAVFRSQVPLTVGQAIFLRIYLPQMDMISARAVITRSQSTVFFNGKQITRLAVEFTSLSSGDARRLSQFIFHYQVQNARYRIS